MNGNLRRTVLLAVLLVGGVAFAESEEKAEVPARSSFPALDWLRDTLAEFSVVAFPRPDGGTREVVTTRTQGLISADAFVLTYERVTYARGDEAQIDVRQLIVYALQPSALDASSVTTQRQGPLAPGQDSAFWIVTAAVRADPGFIEYDNIFESRRADGTPELTRSRGRVREIAIGYFLREDVAVRVATQFRDHLASLPGAPDPGAAPNAPHISVKDPIRSGA